VGSREKLSSLGAQKIEHRLGRWQLEGDRTASGPGRQWLRPAIFRRAPTRKHILDD
jgi:hypothetical protein